MSVSYIYKCKELTEFVYNNNVARRKHQEKAIKKAKGFLSKNFNFLTK